MPVAFWEKSEGGAFKDKNQTAGLDLSELEVLYIYMTRSGLHITIHAHTTC